MCDDERYLAWCDAQGIRTHHVAPGLVAEGWRGVVATQPLAPGDTVMRVPERLLLSAVSARRDPQLSQALTQHQQQHQQQPLSSHQVLALHLLHEASKGPASLWHPYIQQLPRQHSSCVHWGPVAVQALQLPYAQEAVQAAIDKARGEWAAARPVLQQLGVDKKWCSWRAWQWSLSMVASRTMFHPADPSCGCLTPLADLHNHAPPPAPHTPDLGQGLRGLLLQQEQQQQQQQQQEGRQQQEGAQQQEQQQVPEQLQEQLQQEQQLQEQVPDQAQHEEPQPQCQEQHQEDQEDQQQQQQQQCPDSHPPPQAALHAARPGCQGAGSSSVSPQRVSCSSCADTSTAIAHQPNDDNSNSSASSGTSADAASAPDGVASAPAAACQGGGCLGDAQAAASFSSTTPTAAAGSEAASSSEGADAEEEAVGGDGHFDQAAGCYKIVARRGYQPGEQVFLCYGRHTNLELCELYGFLLRQSNPHDTALLPVELLQQTLQQLVHAQQQQQQPQFKRQQRSSWQEQQAGHRVELDLSAADCWVHSNGQPSWQLLSALRCAAASPAEAASCGYKALCGEPISLSSELLTLQALASTCRAQLAALPTSQQQDEQLLSATRQQTAGVAAVNEARAGDAARGCSASGGAGDPTQAECLALALQWRHSYKSALLACVERCESALRCVAKPREPQPVKPR